MMDVPNISLRWLQIILTLFYGQVFSTGIYEYSIQGICVLILHIRPIYDSILLIILAILMFTFVINAILAIWYCHRRMCIISILILIIIFLLTLVKSIIEIIYMDIYPIRTEWIVIRITELIIRIFGIVISVLFVISLRQGFEPENF